MSIAANVVDRETHYVVEAVEEFRSGNKSDAYKLLDKSTEQINTLVSVIFVVHYRLSC